MEYFIGLGLALTVIATTLYLKLHRDKSFYPTLLIVIAFYYVLFAAISGDVQTLTTEIVIALLFTIIALVGYKTSTIIVALGLILHGVFDLSHHLFLSNDHVPIWWIGFCFVVDVLLGLWLLGHQIFIRKQKVLK